VQLEGGVLTIRARDQGYLTSLSGILGDDIKLARTYLANTLAQLQNQQPPGAVLKYAHRYFLTPENAIPAPDLQKILSVIVKTGNGLAGDQTIKVGLLVGRDDKDVHGSVRQRMRANTKSYHNQAVDLDDGDTWRMGAMRIDADTLEKGGRLGVVTLIHEATHKYAGTNDYCYFKNNSRDPNPGTGKSFNDKAEALKNADSYAWFTYKVGRKFMA
jgi:hypothetical protein